MIRLRRASERGHFDHGWLDTYHCQLVLEEQGEPQSSFWLASQVTEMRLWRASEADVRDALTQDISRHGEASRFVALADDAFALRSWVEKSL